MKFRLATTAFTLLALTLSGLSLRAGEDEKDPVKKGLKELNDFVGSWKGSGKGAKGPTKDWTESMEMSWKFAEKDTHIALAVKDGKLLQSGEVRFDPKKKQYNLQAKLAGESAPLEFTGKIKGSTLTFSRTDDAGNKQDLVMLTTNDGGLMTYRYQVTDKGKTLAAKMGEVNLKKEGFSLAAGGKRPECVVTGGLGTMPVMFNGKTYYVCCSGCRDAFAETPEKFVKAFESKKK